MGGGGEMSQSNSRIRVRPLSSKHKLSISQSENHNKNFGIIVVLFSSLNKGKTLGIVGTIALHLPKVATCDDLLSYPIPRWSVDAGACQMGRTFNKVVQAKILCNN